LFYQQADATRVREKIMTISVTTNQSEIYNCPADWAYDGISSLTLSNCVGLVSIGVQTVGNQFQFGIVQNFVQSNGTGGYVQVVNTSNSDTQFYVYPVCISDSSETASKGDIKFELLTETKTNGKESD
jgi:hypothetical protein